ncbi:Hypothetical protein HEAR1834 [Herminiimonas arsenicoxydans]|uniref:Uncharacterized protein n=1 Tax=Herminiimonas arsenicoxydans TaxID=204773 RepID=A4G652_HERAR|nr:Hypothetical protein HEAR1834 [Herminiimonas arsenicoxydans]
MRNRAAIETSAIIIETLIIDLRALNVRQRFGERQLLREQQSKGKPDINKKARFHQREQSQQCMEANEAGKASQIWRIDYKSIQKNACCIRH